MSLRTALMVAAPIRTVGWPPALEVVAGVGEIEALIG